MKVTSPFGVDSYIPGDHYLIDDLTGFKIRRSEARKTWDGLIVHKDNWDPKHPQLEIKARKDSQRIPEARSEPADSFLNVGDVTADDL